MHKTICLLAAGEAAGETLKDGMKFMWTVGLLTAILICVEGKTRYTLIIDKIIFSRYKIVVYTTIVIKRQ